MRRVLILAMVLGITLPALARGRTAAAPAAEGDPQVISAVNQWMGAFQKKDVAGLRALGNTTFDEWIVSNSATLRKDISLESALHPVTEYRIERVATLVPGQMAVAHVQEIIEDEAVREWEATLTLSRTGGTWQVSHASHIVVEYHMPGYPEGCPETVFRRDEEASLDGNLRGGADPTFVRVFTLRRDTEPWGGGAREIDTEATKCQMKPETVVRDLEWLVAAWDGEILMTQQIGRATEMGGGITLFDGVSGHLTRGGVRLENIVSGQPGVLFLSRVYRGGEKSGIAAARLGAYVWKGSSLKKIWDFDFLRKGAWFSVDLKPGDDGKVVVATLERNGDAIGCPDGTVIPFKWTGSTFKVAEKGIKGGCTGSSWPGEGGLLSRDGFKLPPANTPHETAN